MGQSRKSRPVEVGSKYIIKLESQEMRDRVLASINRYQNGSKPRTSTRLTSWADSKPQLSQIDVFLRNVSALGKASDKDTPKNNVDSCEGTNAEDSEEAKTPKANWTSQWQ